MIQSTGCPVWPSDEELNAMIGRDSKREQDVIAQVQHLQAVTDAAEQQWQQIPLEEKYRLGKSLLLKPQNTPGKDAIPYLERAVAESAHYKDSLTLLGKAYYYDGRFQDAAAILQRALVVNHEDEIAWMAFGLARMRLGDHQKGLEALRGGITLFSKASRPGYHGFPNWDQKGAVRNSMRRAGFQLVNEQTASKENIIADCELLLRTVDAEELAQQIR
jgi:tetratricopeptide (TPR) repeat protein